VNQPLTAKELSRLKLSEGRSRPYGEDAWVGCTAGKLGLEYTLRDRAERGRQGEGERWGASHEVIRYVSLGLSADDFGMMVLTSRANLAG
jgi:hypothetical protein